MNRSGYTSDIGDHLEYGRWRGQVASSIKSKRGQAFLKELASAMDAMPEKVLIKNNLVDDSGNCCTIGVICKKRNIDTKEVDCSDPESVGGIVGISKQMAAEIEYWNDEVGEDLVNTGTESNPSWKWVDETPQERWKRMREWVEKHIKKDQ